MEPDEVIICWQCHAVLYKNEDYYDTPFGNYCPDCMDAIVRDWKCVVGDTIERC